MAALRSVLAIALLCVPVQPCSAFLVRGDGRVLFCNNEDFWYAETRVWFEPPEKSRHGVLYVGYDNGFPQGGLNDAGLAFDGFATAPREMTRQSSHTRFPGNPISEAMRTCSSVAEVVAFLKTIDLRPVLTRGMLLFADASGDAVIVEGDDFVRIGDGDGQLVCTNFYQSAHEDDRAQCPRYSAVLDLLEARETTDLALCTRALAAGAQRGEQVATVYSNVFDLKTLEVRLYLFHDYDHPVVLDLREELAKGARVLELPALFERNEAFESFAERQRAAEKQRIEERKGPRLPDEVLDGYAGAYAITVDERTYRLTVRRNDDHLVAEGELLTGSGGARIFHSAAEADFFSVRGLSVLTVHFWRDDEGTVTGFRLSHGNSRFEAKRLAE